MTKATSMSCEMLPLEYGICVYPVGNISELFTVQSTIILGISKAEMSHRNDCFSSWLGRVFSFDICFWLISGLAHLPLVLTPCAVQEEGNHAGWWVESPRAGALESPSAQLHPPQFIIYVLPPQSLLSPYNKDNNLYLAKLWRLLRQCGKSLKVLAHAGTTAL